MVAVDHRRSTDPDALLVAEVIWTDRALADIEDLVGWISNDKPMAAVRMAERLQTSGDSLAHFPSRGRPISAGRRELTHVRPYLIRYRVEGDVVTILEVRHGAREPE